MKAAIVKRAAELLEQRELWNGLAQVADRGDDFYLIGSGHSCSATVPPDIAAAFIARQIEEIDAQLATLGVEP